MEHGDESLDHPVHAPGPGRALRGASIHGAGDAPGLVSKTPLVLRLALAALLLAPAVFWRGGVLEEETIVFLSHYLDQRTVVEKVFDPHGNDFGTYQARELSYFFDFLDAQWLKSLLRSGIVLFVPPSALLASILTWLVFARGSARAFPELPAPTRSLVLLVLLTSYVFLTTMGLFYRATKPLLTPFLLALLFFLWRRLGRDAGLSAPGRDFGVVFGLGVLASAFDRQGFFYVAVLTATLGLFWVLRRRGAALLLGAGGAAAAGAAYNYLLGPFVIHAVNGYWPRFNYQRMPMRKLLDPTYYAKAIELLPEYAATLFGGFPTWLFGVLAVAAAIGWLRLRRRASAEAAPPTGAGATSLTVLLFVLFLASQVFMFAAMIMRYPMVYDWADHRLWYFPWPFQAILAFGLLAGLADVWPRIGRRGHEVIDLALVLLAVANVAQWPRHREISLHSDWFPKIHAQTERLVASLHDGKADPGLYGAYREFLHFAWDRSPALRSRISAEPREGSGFYRTELREGRLFAWARKGASLALVTGEAGDYRFEGDLWLRSGETVSVSRAQVLVARVRRAAEGEGRTPLSLVLALPAGSTELTFESDLDERDVGGVRDQKAVSFGLFLPGLERVRTAPWTRISRSVVRAAHQEGQADTEDRPLLLGPVQLAGDRYLRRGAQHHAPTHVDEKVGRQVENRASGVLAKLPRRGDLVSTRMAEVELHDAVETPAELVLVGYVHEHAAAVAVGQVVLAGVPVLSRGEDRRFLVEEVEEGQASEYVGRARARLGVLVGASAVDGSAVVAQGGLHSAQDG
jgi:hypothetical protein